MPIWKRSTLCGEEDGLFALLIVQDINIWEKPVVCTGKQVQESHAFHDTFAEGFLLATELADIVNPYGHRLSFVFRWHIITEMIAAFAIC